MDSVVCTPVSIECADSNNCIIASMLQGRWPYVRSSKDGGFTWETVLLDSTKVPIILNNGDTVFTDKWDLLCIQDMAFPDTSLIIMTLKKGATLKSTDLGKTWQEEIVDTSGSYLFHISMYNKQFGTIVTSENLFITEDGSKSWKKVRLTDSVENSILMNTQTINDSCIYVTGGLKIMLDSTSFILKSTDKGNTWEKLCDVNRIRNILFLDENYGYAYGAYCIDKTNLKYRFNIKRTFDAGKSWKNILDTTFSYTSYNMKTIHDSSFVFYFQGIVLIFINDRGNALSEYRHIPGKSKTYESIRSVEVVDGILFALTIDGLIFRYFPDSPDEVDIHESGDSQQGAVYPNPAVAGNTVFVNPNNDKIFDMNSQVLLVNALGALTYAPYEITNSRIGVSLPYDLPSGMYFIIVRSEGEIIFKDNILIIKN